MTANLQMVTIKQIAIAMNVSERMIYMGKKVLELRPDLEAVIMAGKMSMNAAYSIATGKTKPTSFDRLVTAWNSASPEDRHRLVVEVIPCERAGAADSLQTEAA